MGVFMNKKYILKRNEDILLVIKTGIKRVYNHLIIYIKENKLTNSRFCVSVSKKIGKANVRNLYKRRIKDILMKNNIDNSYDYVIILRKAILDINYNSIKNELINILEERK